MEEGEGDENGLERVYTLGADLMKDDPLER